MLFLLLLQTSVQVPSGIQAAENTVGESPRSFDAQHGALQS